MYAVYCSNYDTAEALISKLKSKRKDFEQQLTVRPPHTLTPPSLTHYTFIPSHHSHTLTLHPHTLTHSHTLHPHTTHIPSHHSLILTPLQACFSDSRVRTGLTLPMYLITPVQRITRYILLLKVQYNFN